MFNEIVLPKKNENKFAEIASRLGIMKLYFLYNFDEFDEKIQENADKVNDYKGIKVEIGFIVNQKNIKKACKKSDLIAVKSSEQDRFFIEGKRINLIYGFEETNKKDFLHQRASGLNHILCDIIRKNSISVGFSYSNLLQSNQAMLIGRLIQNIRLCQKYKVKTVISSFTSDPYLLRQPHDVISLFSMLGMDRKMERSH